MKRPNTMSEVHAAASASALSLATGAVVHLPARVPLDAPTIPEGIVRPWERALPGVFALIMAIAWFLTTPAVAT
jgi:hypothetical protein